VRRCSAAEPLPARSPPSVGELRGIRGAPQFKARGATTCSASVMGLCVCSMAAPEDHQTRRTPTPLAMVSERALKLSLDVWEPAYYGRLARSPGVRDSHEHLRSTSWSTGTSWPATWPPPDPDTITGVALQASSQPCFDAMPLPSGGFFLIALSESLCAGCCRRSCGGARRLGRSTCASAIGKEGGAADDQASA